MMSSEVKEEESHSDFHHSSLIDSGKGYGAPEPQPKAENRESEIPNSWRKSQSKNTPRRVQTHEATVTGRWCGQL